MQDREWPKGDGEVSAELPSLVGEAISEVAAQSHVARDLVIGDRTEAEAQAFIPVVAEHLVQAQINGPQFLDCSKGYLYKLTMRNMIPHYKPTGKRIYFYRAELDDWIKQGKVKTTEEISQEALKYCVDNPSTATKRHNTRNEK
jgi:excisionase family DNA binding protein